MRGRLCASAPQWSRRALRLRNQHVSAGVAVRLAQLWAVLQAAWPRGAVAQPGQVCMAPER